MNCLIVDDEQLARDVIELYIGKIDFLHLAGSYSGALPAFSHLSKEPVDLIFLDIKMPEINGLEFIRTIKNPPKIILTTAFHEYALDGFDLNVVDYLLKPISFERFIKAVDKVKTLRDLTTAGAGTGMTATAQEFYVRSDRKLIRLHPSDIIFIEGMKNYLSIHTPKEKIIVHNTMINIENELSSFPDILRVHKSFLVNKNYIRELDSNLIRLTTGDTLPLGGIYKDQFMNAMRII
jgi:DNA-binding LytR/AlgR family response regulator